MPIPKPEYSENQRKFIQRCLVDDIMVKEYPNVDQRLAVCAVQANTSLYGKDDIFIWRNKDK